MAAPAHHRLSTPLQHVIKAPAAATVSAVHFGVGEFVEDGRELVAFASTAAVAAAAP